LAQACGSLLVFTVIARDEFGNERDSGGDTFRAKLIGPSEPAILISDEGTGAYVPSCACAVNDARVIDSRRRRSLPPGPL
jgi:hypothetical protein